MVIQKKLKERVVGVGIVLVLLALGLYFSPIKTNTLFEKLVPSPTPTPIPPFGTYQAPTIAKKDFYRIAMVGDSMTNVLGIHGGALSEKLNMLYQSESGHQRILIDNYAMGSTNILELNDQMNRKVTLGNVVLDPLLSRSFDMILVESFGYNPLSQFGVTNGLEKQKETLDQAMKLLTKRYPNTAIVFVATIAPNKETYGLEENVGALSDRIAQAQERMAYIRDHMDFAKAHGIPLIDIFDASLTSDGDGNILYVSPTDHIHPSFAGIDFIDTQIANFIYQSKILPQ